MRPILSMLAFCLFLSASAPAAGAEAGGLTLYTFPTEGGTVTTFQLDQWYPALAPGRCTLTLRYRAAEGLIGLLCNDVELDVPADHGAPNVNERGR